MGGEPQADASDELRSAIETIVKHAPAAPDPNTSYDYLDVRINVSRVKREDGFVVQLREIEFRQTLRS